MQKYIPKIALLSLAVFLTACSSTASNQAMMTGDTTSLSGLKSMCNLNPRPDATTQGQVGKIREMALRETALTLGAQGGLAYRARIIDEELTDQARYLDTVFDFNSLVLEHNILPPVLLEGRNTLNLADTQTIRISDRVYKVSKQARFITTPPTWRQYLWMDYKKPDYPNITLLPKYVTERQIWSFYVTRGWKKGVEQANTIIEENVARIKEDYSGMILYRKLYAMNMVSPPFVSHTDLGVTGDENEIHIDDRVLRITALPGLNTNSKEWRAPVTKDEAALEQFVNMEQLAENAKVTITNKSWQPNITPVN